jgi:hypothetical protein
LSCSLCSGVMYTVVETFFLAMGTPLLECERDDA